MILADTSVLSLVFRRQRTIRPTREWVELATLILTGNVGIIGAVRQEILTGIRTDGEFERLRTDLSQIPQIPTLDEDYEAAAHLANQCRRAGIQGSATDFLLCSVSTRTSIHIFTTDADFQRFARVIPVRLHEYR